MRILVTGSSGHLGEALMRTLRESEHEPVGLDFLASPFTDRVLAAGTTTIRAVHIEELRKRINVLRAGAGLSTIFWNDFSTIGNRFL